MRTGFADRFFGGAVRLFAFLVLVLLGAIIISLIYSSSASWDASHFSFLWKSIWDPNANDYVGEFGALVPIVGTLASSAIAVLIAVPVSFGIAMFLTQLCPKPLRRPLGIAVEMLAAIPSVIYGMWGLLVFVPFFQRYIQGYLVSAFANIPILDHLFAGPPVGTGIFTAGFILAIMIVPYIASIMRDVFDTVPAVLKESAYGLGSTTWEVMRSVVVPYSRGGMIGGVMLGLGRALGETMAVTFVIGNAFKLPTSLFSASNSIASAIANEFNEAGGLQRSALLELGLILFVITTIVLGLSRWMVRHLEKKEGGKA